jgi:hypothetical protein
MKVLAAFPCYVLAKQIIIQHACHPLVLCAIIRQRQSVISLIRKKVLDPSHRSILCRKLSTYLPFIHRLSLYTN